MNVRRPLGVSRLVPRRGMVLIVVLVLLTVLLLGAASVMRSVDTGNVVSGNYSFQQSAVQAADRALTDALNAAANIVPAGGANMPVANRYYNVRQSAVDHRGFPSAVNWTNVSCVDPSGGTITGCDADNGSFRIQYVVERLCASNPDLADVTDIRAKCEYEASAAATSPTTIAVRYRVIMRVRGPRGTDQWFEAVVSGPATT